MGTESSDQAFTCVVCAEPVTFAMSAECNWCDARYHLNQRNDVDAKDCGAVWIDEQFLALQFACNNCLAANRLAPPDAMPAPQPTARTAQRRRYRRRE